MSDLNVGKYAAGLLMAGGSCIVLLMLSDILYKALIIAGEFISARIHGREHTDYPKFMILSSGFGIGDFSGMNGVMLPLILGVFAGGFIFCTFGIKQAALPILVLLLWTVTWACLSNVQHHRSFNLHSVLLVKNFFACFVTSHSTQDAMVNAFSAIPPGAVKSGMKECIKQSEKNVPWERAIRVFDNGTFSGQVVSSYLNIFENSNAIITDEITASFTKDLAERAAGIIKNQKETRSANLALLTASLVYTFVSAWDIYAGNTSGAHMFILYIAGIMLAAARLILRNAVVCGRLV